MTTVGDARSVEVKFHYANELLVRWITARRPGFRPDADSFGLSRHVEIAQTWSQTGASSRDGLRPASELDSTW